MGGQQIPTLLGHVVHSGLLLSSVEFETGMMMVEFEKSGAAGDVVVAFAAGEVVSFEERPKRRWSAFGRGF